MQADDNVPFQDADAIEPEDIEIVGVTLGCQHDRQLDEAQVIDLCDD